MSRGCYPRALTWLLRWDLAVADGQRERHLGFDLLDGTVHRCDVVNGARLQLQTYGQQSGAIRRKAPRQPNLSRLHRSRARSRRCFTVAAADRYCVASYVELDALHRRESGGVGCASPLPCFIRPVRDARQNFIRKRSVNVNGNGRKPRLPCVDRILAARPNGYRRWFGRQPGMRRRLRPRQSPRPAARAASR